MKEKKIEVRCEYEEWSLLTDLFLYDTTKNTIHLDKANERIKTLLNYTNADGGICFGTKDDKVWVGENGLASWGAIKLYKITHDSTYLDIARKWLNYCIINPPKPNKKEPKLYPVFLAWINYALMEMASLKQNDYQTWKGLAEECTQQLLNKMKKGRHWDICYHYDLYCARNLLYAYQFFTIRQENVELGSKCLVALSQFMRSSRHTKIPLLNVRPIHYLFFDWRGSGYSTLQYAQLCYELYLTYYNIDDLLEAKVALEACQKHLTRKDGSVVKHWGDRKGNSLASDWLRYVEALDKRCSLVAKEWL